MKPRISDHTGDVFLWLVWTCEGNAEIKVGRDRAKCQFESQRMESRAATLRVNSLFFGKVLFSQIYSVEGSELRSHKARLWTSPATPVNSFLLAFSSHPWRRINRLTPLMLMEDVINKKERLLKVARSGKGEAWHHFPCADHQ